MTKAEHARIVAWRLRILQHAEGEPGKSFYDYTAKQQAMIVQTWFEDPAKRIVPEYRRLIEQVRQAGPISRALIVEEAAFGPGMGSVRNLPETEFAPTIPFLRLDW